MSNHLREAEEKLTNIREHLQPNEFFTDDFGDLYEAVCQIVKYLRLSRVKKPENWVEAGSLEEYKRGNPNVK